MADIESEITELLIRIARRQRQRGSFRNGGFDLGGLTPHQARIIGFIDGKQDTGVVARDIADITGARAASVSVLLSKLEADGWVERRTDPSDSRRKTLHVTDKGRDLVTRFEAHAEAESRLDLSMFTATERDSLKALLTKLDRSSTD